jgi:predicted PurR-regulated permease PerM/methylmalonyl-CoA mutase cobalamin-binding subunit
MTRAPHPQKKPLFYALGSIAVVLGLLYFGQAILIPLALALLFAFLLAPLVDRFEALRLGRVGSTLIVILLALSVIGGFGWVIEQRFSEIIQRLPEYRDEVRAKIQRLRETGGAVQRISAEITQSVTEFPATQSTTARSAPSQSKRLSESSHAERSTQAAQPVPTPDNPLPVRVFPLPESPVAIFGEYIGKFFGPLLTAGLIVVFICFMLIGREDLRDRFIHLAGQGRLNVTTEALSEAAARVSRFLIAQSLVNVMFGASVALGLWIIDLTIGQNKEGLLTALVAGLLCGVLRFVPYIGTWIGAAMPLAVAFATYPGNGVFFVTLAMFIGLELIVSQAIEPNLVGSSTGISPMAVLVATVFWTWLWGPMGLLLSTPITVLLVVMGKYIPQLEVLDTLLGDKPVLEPKMRIYQRLIAGDDEEATDLAIEYLKEMSLEEVYDRVLLPALADSQRDRHVDDLDDARALAVRRGIREIVETLAEQAPKELKPAPVPPAADITPAGAPLSQPPPKPPPAILPPDLVIKVLCLAARDESDEIAALMFAQLLQRRGFHVDVAGAGTLTSEMAGLIEQYKAEIVVISSLPPKAGVHARYVLKRLTARYSDLKAIVGLWVNKRDVTKQPLGDFRPAQVVTSLAEAQKYVDQFIPQIIIDRSNAA